MHDWGKIKDSIFQYSKYAFSENGVVVLDSEIEEAILIFYNLVNVHVPYHKLSSLASEIFPNLQEACVDNIGHLSSLKSLSTLFEVFCKKLLVKAGVCNYTTADLNMLRRLLDISGKLPMSESITDSTLGSYYGNTAGYYILGFAYLTRNQVHNSPAWDSAEVVRRLRYVLASYILLVHFFKSDLLCHDSSLSASIPMHFSQNEENALLYDYLSYGNSSITIKNRFIDTYIQHQLYKYGSLTEDDLIKKVNDFSDNSLAASAAKRKLESLARLDSISVITSVPKTYGLNSDEHNRIKEAEENFNEAMASFDTAMHDLLLEYGLNNQYDKVLSIVNQHIEAQYNYDINEALLDFQNENRNTISSYTDFLDKLQRIGCGQEAESIYKSILNICKDNDVLVRINAGKAFRRLSDPEQFDSYVRKAERDVWIDTQILLYLLCYNEDFAAYDHAYYKAAYNLFQMQHRKTFHYKVPHFYVRELVYHLRQALLLISLVDSKFAQGIELSKNVFFQHYLCLKRNDGLPEDIETFEDYMEKHFNLCENDAYESDFTSIAVGVVESMLQNFNVEIISVPLFEDKSMTNSCFIFEQAAKEKSVKPKDGHTLTNDSWMGLVLFENKDEYKPIFLTLDSMFEPYRRLYAGRYKRGQTFNWHLFSPSKFINHIDFIDFKISATNLTDDLISLIEIPTVKDKTLSVLDRFSRFLDIPNLSYGQRKRYIQWTSELFVQKEFEYESDPVHVESMTEQLSKFLDTQDSIFVYFHDKKNKQLSEFQNMLRNEQEFKTYVNYINTFSQSSEDNIEELILLIEKKVADYMHSLESKNN